MDIQLFINEVLFTFYLTTEVVIYNKLRNFNGRDEFSLTITNRLVFQILIGMRLNQQKDINKIRACLRHRHYIAMTTR